MKLWFIWKQYKDTKRWFRIIEYIYIYIIAMLFDIKKYAYKVFMKIPIVTSLTKIIL